MADKKYSLKFKLSDGNVKEVEFTVPEGEKGSNGKSAYEYAKEGGYTGTEAEFAAKMAEEYIQPDWNAAEGEPGHVLNRTHWEEKDATIILEEQEVAFDNYQAFLPGVLPIVPGEVYTVYFDGIPYSCRCKRSALQGAATYALGNEAICLTGNDTGEPFVLGVISAHGISGVFVADTETTHTIKITQSRFYPLDNRYSDNTFYITVTSEGEAAYTIKETAEEVIKAYDSGKNLVCKLVFDKSTSSLTRFCESYLPLCCEKFVSAENVNGIILEFCGVYSVSNDDKIEMAKVMLQLGRYPTPAIGAPIVTGCRISCATFDPYVSM